MTEVNIKQRRAGTFVTRINTSHNWAQVHLVAEHQVNPAEVHFIVQWRVTTSWNKASTKKTFARSDALCFWCLCSNHLYKDSRSSNLSLMQDRRQNPASRDKTESSTNKNQEESQGTAISYKTAVSKQNKQSNARGVLHSMILPVTISHKDNPELWIETCALLGSICQTAAS